MPRNVENFDQLAVLIQRFGIDQLSSFNDSGWLKHSSCAEILSNYLR